MNSSDRIARIASGHIKTNNRIPLGASAAFLQELSQMLRDGTPVPEHYIVGLEGIAGQLLGEHVVLDRLLTGMK